jgi:hypothetical protein
MRTAWLMAGLLCGAAARAQDGGAPPKPVERKDAAEKPPLTKEDAELVKDLALLERLELLRNFELFEQEASPKQTKEDRP